MHHGIAPTVDNFEIATDEKELQLTLSWDYSSHLDLSQRKHT